jgi:hypothetical protein
MSSFTNAIPFQMWAIGLCLALTLAGLSLGGICAYLWKRRPAKLDRLRASRVEMRLSQLANDSAVQSRTSN